MADQTLTMADRDWLFAEFSATRQQLTAQDDRIRAEMTAGFESVRKELKDHAADDRTVADRVLAMETERRIEASRTMKRGAWAGIFAAAGLGTAWEVFKYLLHVK